MKRVILKVLKIAGVICLFLLAAAYFAVGTLIVQYEEGRAVCKEIAIHVLDSAENRLVLDEDVYAFLAKSKLSLAGSKLQEINLYQLEELLGKQSGVKKCEVSTQLNGVLTLRISQRTPLLRLETASGKGFYLDDSGELFPTLPRRTVYVPVVSGNIPTDQPQWLKQLHLFGCYLRQNRFWNAQIEQIYVHGPHDIEIIQRVGKQTVMMGDLYHFDYKLQKLYTFYRTVAATEGWDKYDYLDLRFGDQIVCRSTTSLPASNTSRQYLNP